MNRFPLMMWVLVVLPSAALAQTAGMGNMDRQGNRPVGVPAVNFTGGEAGGAAPRGPAQWRPLGPFGGDVEDMNFSPTAAGVMLAGIAPAGSAGGRLYRSASSGGSWSQVTSFGERSAYDIEFAANGTVWVASDDSLWVSTDNGVNFIQRDLGIGLNDQTFAVEIDPTNPQVIWAGVADALGNQTMNVMKSINGGTTWSNVTPPGGAGMSCTDIAINPTNTGQVMAAFGGAFGGGRVFFTSNGGTSWTDVSAGLPTTPVRAVRYDHGRWFVTGGQLFGSQFFGLWQSINNGTSWTQLDNGWPRAIGTGIAIDPNNQNVILAATVDGVHKSINGGATWTISSGATAAFSLANVRFAPGSSTSVGMGAASFGVILSDNAVSTTRISSVGIGALDVFSVAANPNNASELAVAFQGLNNGGVYSSTDAGATWHVESLPGTRYNYAKFDQAGKLYALSDGPTGIAQEGVYRREPNGSWVNFGPFVGSLFETELWSIDIGTVNPNLKITGGNDFGVAGFEATIWRSPNVMPNWTKVFESAPAGEGAVVQRVMIIPDGNDQTVLAAAQTFSTFPINGVYRSVDNGVTWNQVLGTGLPTTLWGYDLTTAPGDPHTVYVADGSFSGGGIYKSVDAGVNWTTYLTGFNIRGVAVDPTSPGDLYFWTVFAAAPVYHASANGTVVVPANAGLTTGSPRQIIAVPGSRPRLLLATTVGAYELALGTECRADFNVDGVVNSQDFFDFLTAFFEQDPSADFNGDHVINSQDFFDFLTEFFVGCP